MHEQLERQESLLHKRFFKKIIVLPDNLRPIISNLSKRKRELKLGLSRVSGSKILATLCRFGQTISGNLILSRKQMFAVLDVTTGSLVNTRPGVKVMKWGGLLTGILLAFQLCRPPWKRKKSYPFLFRAVDGYVYTTLVFAARLHQNSSWSRIYSRQDSPPTV